LKKKRLKNRGGIKMETQLSQQVRELTTRNYDIFMGLDVDKTSMAVSILDHEHAIKSMHIPNNAANLIAYVQKNFADKKVAFTYEAGPTGWGLHDALAREGHQCLVVAPSMVPKAPGARVKTNRLDSKKLAESLRGGLLKGVHIPAGPYRELRHLTQLRDNFVDQSTAAQRRIKALLLFESVAFPEQGAGGSWSREVIAQLKKLPVSGAVLFKLKQLLDDLAFSKGKVMETTKEIQRFCKEDAEIQRSMGYLTSIPGIGQIAGSALLARLGGWRHLVNVRQVGSFLGLTQSE
jgi:transposase